MASEQVRAIQRKKKASVSKDGHNASSSHPSSAATTTPGSQEAQEEYLERGATAGPSSPSRRRRRPSATRRRSSSITAAASLISSYSKSPTKKGRRNSSQAMQPQEDSDEQSFDDAPGESSRRPAMSRKGTSDSPFAGGAAEAFQEARDALGNSIASPYHMALVTLLGSLAQGMPLASMFKVYSYTMCRVYQARQQSLQLSKGGALYSFMMLPPAPELPSDPICQDPWVQKATSTYAAAMATVGALLGLILLERCTRISRRFGRKPLMLITHFLLALAFVIFRVSTLLPTYLAAVVLYVAVMVFEASAGAPLRMAIQNYVVDTTGETQRAGALSFIDGFGQLGAFPSTTLGGLLAAATQKFFAPFYASISIYIVAMIYILVFVPESKKVRHHTLIDDWEHGAAENEGVESSPQSKLANGQAASRPDGMAGVPATDSEEGSQQQGSYISTAISEQSSIDRSRFHRLIRRLNFLSPLSIFLPFKSSKEDGGRLRRDWRLFNLAVIVVFEESFQVFLVPILLLYNSQVFQFDVVQNGYLVSLLQGTRALFLTLIFPPAVAKAREWIGKRHRAHLVTSPGNNDSERVSLLQDGQEQTQYGTSTHSNDRHHHPPTPGQSVEARDMADEEQRTEDVQVEQEAKREERGKLDIVIMILSYLLCTGAFLLLCTTRGQKDNGSIPPWLTIGIAIVGIELGAGATSVRTALIVNAVGQESDQSKALAANQILCTGVYALVPLVTSSIFGWGLSMGRPEIVWAYKAIMAALSAISAAALFLSYPHSGSHIATSSST